MLRQRTLGATEHPLASLSLVSINDIPEEIHGNGRRRAMIHSVRGRLWQSRRLGAVWTMLNESSANRKLTEAAHWWAIVSIGDKTLKIPLQNRGGGEQTAQACAKAC